MRFQKGLKSIVWLAVLAALLLAAGGLPAHTKQGINGVVSVLALPLWVKQAEFVTRDWHYRDLAAQITLGIESPREKALAIVRWVDAHIRRDIPQGWPIFDDHLWNVVIRGYGTDDQMADLASTLCVYSGIPATMLWLKGPTHENLCFAMAFRLDGQWYFMDLYRRAVPKDLNGPWWTVEEVSARPELIVQYTGIETVNGVPYRDFLAKSSEAARNPEARRRPYFQMPLARPWMEITDRLWIKRSA